MKDPCRICNRGWRPVSAVFPNTKVSSLLPLGLCDRLEKVPLLPRRATQGEPFSYPEDPPTRRPHVPAPPNPWHDSPLRNWSCRLCEHRNPDNEDICCQQCGAAKR